MTCVEFKEIAALFAAGALDPPERSAAEAHLGEPTHEGCFEVLRGAREFLLLARPHLIVETHAPELEGACASALIEAGYSPRVVTQRKLLPSDRSWPPGTPGQNRWLIALGGSSP